MIDFLQGANLMNSIGSVAGTSAAGLGSMATAFMPTISSTLAPAAGFSAGALGSGLGIGSTGLVGTGLPMGGSLGGSLAQGYMRFRLLSISGWNSFG